MTRASEIFGLRANKARQSGEDMLRRSAVCPRPFSEVSELFIAEKDSQDVRRSEEEKADKKGPKEVVEEDVKEEVEDEVNAISACKLNTWNGGEAIATRRNLQVDMEPTIEIFYKYNLPMKLPCLIII